jgi:hypothetical protein
VQQFFYCDNEPPRWAQAVKNKKRIVQTRFYLVWTIRAGCTCV